jgi:hypothetical protein
MFYVKKSGGNTLRRTSLNTWLSRQLSEPMATMQLTGKTAKGLINGIIKIAYDSLQGQGATIQEAKYDFDPSTARAFLGGGVERRKKNKNVKTIGGGRIEQLKSQLIQIQLSKDDLQTKINNWFKVYKQIYEIELKYNVKTIEPSNLKEKILELNKTKDVKQLVKIASEEINSFGDSEPGKIQITFFNIMYEIITGKKTKASQQNQQERDEDYPVDTSKAHKYSVPVSEIQKFVRDYYQKNAPEGAKKDETMMGQNLNNLTGEVLTLIKKWIKYQTDSSQEQLRGKKDSEERTKKAKETLGINESQILRWKQIAGILKD